MTTPPGYRPLDLGQGRSADFLAIDSWAFSLPEAAVASDGIVATVDWSRSRGMETTGGAGTATGGAHTATGELASVHSSYGYTMRVPGGTVPTSGLTWVGVHPAHRRRGLLKSMINDHFRRSLARGEVVSTLIAAETTIYQRFGYGLACPTYRLTLPRGAEFRAVAGSNELRLTLASADLAAHGPAIRAVLARDPRPGAMVTIDDALLANLFFDPEGVRDGQERRRIAIVEDERGPAAFALFQRKLGWNDSGPEGTGSCQEAWAAVTAAAERRLWSTLADLDLMSSFTVSSVALDSPVIHLLKDVRGATALMRDQVWARILDVPAALMARTYGADLDVVIEVADAQIAENSRAWRLTVSGGAASVSPAEDGAAIDVRASIQELSAAYLGGTTFDALTTAGLVEEVRPGSVATLSDAFRSRMAPRGSSHF